MSAKIIKLTDNNNVTLIPVTDASVVQMSVDGQVKSVKDVILENEEVTAAGYNDLNDRVEVLEDAGYITSIPTYRATATGGTAKYDKTTSGTIGNASLSGTLASFTVSGNTGAKSITIPALNISGNVSNLEEYTKYNAINVTINDTALSLAGGTSTKLQYTYTLAAQTFAVGGQSYSVTIPQKTVTIPDHNHTFTPTHTSTTLSNITQPTITITQQ